MAKTMKIGLRILLNLIKFLEYSIEPVVGENIMSYVCIEYSKKVNNLYRGKNDDKKLCSTTGLITKSFGQLNFGQLNFGQISFVQFCLIDRKIFGQHFF